MAKRSELAQKLLAHLRKEETLRAGERVAVAVSGGADSVALLRLLLEVREELGFVPCVVHFNHQLRGRASDADEKFVNGLAAKYRLEFFAGREDVGAKAKRERANLEDAARQARYAFFERLVREGHVARVAAAHTADDQAETVLAHILRGTGLAGLGGIHLEAGVVFRPLLKIRRAELRSYLKAKKQPWREDASNRDTRRMRARIRQKLIPLLEKQFQPATVDHLCQLAELAREDEAWMKVSAELRVHALAKEKDGEVRIPIAELACHGGKRIQPAQRVAPSLSEIRWSHAMNKRMVRLIVELVKPRAGQLSAAHVEAVLQLAHQTDSGKSLHLPGGVEVLREQEALRFRRMSEKRGTRAGKSQTGNGFSYEVDLTRESAELPIVELGTLLRLRVIDWPPEGRETNTTGEVLDRGRLCLPLVLRSWRPGDAMRPLGRQKSHKLARLLNEIGASRWEKESWPVLTSGGKLAWVRGLPVAAEFAASERTQAGVVITEERKP